MLRKKDASKSKGPDEKGTSSPTGSKKLASYRKDSKSPKMGSKSDVKRLSESESLDMDEEIEQTKIAYGGTTTAPAPASHYDSSDSSSSSVEKAPKTRTGIFTVKAAVGSSSPSAGRKNSRPTTPQVRHKDKKNYNAFSDSVEMGSGEQETFQDDQIVLPESDVDPSPLSTEHGAGAGAGYGRDLDTDMDEFDPFNAPPVGEKVSSPKVASKGLFARKAPAKPKEGKDDFDLPRQRTGSKGEEDLKSSKTILKAEEARKKDKKKAVKAEKEKAEKEKKEKEKKDKKSKASLASLFVVSKKEPPPSKEEGERDTKPRSGSKGSLKGSKNDISDHTSPEPQLVAPMMDSLSSTSSSENDREFGAQDKKMGVRSQPRSGSATFHHAPKKADTHSKQSRKGMEPGVDDSQDSSSLTPGSDRSTWTTMTGIPEITFETFTRYFSQGNNRIDNENRARIMGFSEGVRIAPGANVRVENPDDIGDDIHIGLFTYINGTVTIDDDVTIGPHCAITSNTHLFNPTRQNWKGNNRNDPIHIKRGCWIAANVTITGGITIGECSLVCAGAVVTHDVPDYSIAAGIPARIVGSIDPTTGHKSWHH